MERLTFEVHDGGMFVKESDVKTYAVEDEIMHTGNAVRKLAEYEDLEEQKKLFKLPCAVGDTVYVKMQSGGYAEAEVRDFSHFLSCGFCVVVTSDKFNKQHIPFTEFGKTVFLTFDKIEELEAFAD